MARQRKQHPKKTQKDHSNSALSLGRDARSIFHALPIGVVVFGKDLKIIEANPEAAKLIDLNEKIDKSLTKGTGNMGLPAPDWTKQLGSVVTAAKNRKFNGVSYTLNGKTRLLQLICVPLKSSRTTTRGGILVIEDTTEKVNVQRNLADSERLAALGTLAAKVAHELNNPLDGILRYINLAARIIDAENLEKPKEYLAQCRQGLMRMVQIISELLEFSRGTYASFESAKVEQIIEEAVKTMTSSAEYASVRITTNYAPDIPTIRSGNLLQVFCNLIKNAFDAMPNGGELKISTRLAPNNAAIVQFCDTGTGFEPENAEAIFEPFFTTKDKGRGTGLGLAICKDIIERYHGQITAANDPKGGSIFTVYLPLTNQIP